MGAQGALVGWVWPGGGVTRGCWLAPGVWGGGGGAPLSPGGGVPLLRELGSPPSPPPGGESPLSAPGWVGEE